MSDKDNNLLKSDILTVGSELSEKLNAIGVPNTFGKASEGKDNLMSIIRMTINGLDMTIDQIREILRDYYDKSEVNTLLNGKSDTSHNHDNAYANIIHNHDGAYSSITHNHDSAYANIIHNHDSEDIVDLIDVIYPVGSIYMSVNSVNPSTLFGGTWEQIEDKFLLASGSSYSNGSTGGSADSVVVSHNHKASANNFLESNTTLTRGSQRAYTNANSDGIYYVYSTNSSTNTTFQIHNTTQNAGTSGTGKNMPPYLVVNVWKRIE